MSPSAKLGPLPAWAWGLVLLGGLGLGLYLRRGSKSSPTASLVSAGGPVPSLGAAGGSSDGSQAGVSTGIDPIFAQMLSDSNSALVSESGYFAGLAGQSLDTAVGALGTSAGLVSQLADHYSTQTPVVYVVGSSPSGSSPTGTTTTPTTAPPNPPVPVPPYTPPAPVAPGPSYSYPGSTVRRPGLQLE